MKASLVVATRGRVDELADLFDSLIAQLEPDIEVIVVDQNADDRLGAVIARYAPGLTIRWRKSDVANANHARNLGLRMARGAIVTFPDDDCTYPPGVLARVLAGFDADPELQIMTGPAAAPGGGLGSGRWRADAGEITIENVWTSVIEFNLFLRRETALALGGFDERLGPGTPFGSAEGNDLVVRAIREGHRAQYDPRQQIVHPDKRLTETAVARAGLYGAGLGFVLRRHPVPDAVRRSFLIRPAGGIVVSLLRGRLLAARYYLATLRGRLRGLKAPEARGPWQLAPLTPDTAP